jgi:predicted nucleic acid-binding protein
MPKNGIIVINTGPLIALIAALGNLKILEHLYKRVIVPYEVCQEMVAENATHFGVSEFNEATWLEKREIPEELIPLLQNSLDPGESSVIQVALNEKIPVVCIDESAGRRVARLSGLSVTGSLGILVRAKREGLPIKIEKAINNMKNRGIWISDHLKKQALEEAEK